MKIFVLKGVEETIGNNDYAVGGYIARKANEDELVVKVFKNPSKEPLFDCIKEVLGDSSLPEDIEIVTDNLYVFKALTTYWKKWDENGWKTTKGDPVRDKEVIEKILNLTPPKEYRYQPRDEWPEDLDDIETLLREEGEKKLLQIRKKQPRRKITVRET